MFARAQINRIEDPLNHVSAVAGQQRRDVDVAFLWIFVRIELIERALQLAVNGFVALHLCSYESRAQTFELIVDLLATGVERTRERRIDRLEIPPQTIELMIDVLFSIHEQLRRVCAEMLLDNALDDRS